MSFRARIRAAQQQQEEEEGFFFFFEAGLPHTASHSHPVRRPSSE